MRIPLAGLGLALVLSGCAANGSDATSEVDPEDVLTIYSGRDEELVSPLLADLEDAVGVPVEVRYGDTAELAAQLLEEGENTEADLFFGQDAGALGALSDADLLAPLGKGTTRQVAERFRDEDGMWAPTSARARVLAYHPDQAPQAATFDSVDDLLAPELSGQVGYAPTNASFQAFVTALRVTRGEDGAREWLEAFAANDPVAYDSNTVVLEAVDSGEIGVGLINHYYWYQLAAEMGAESVNAKLRYLDSKDAGALINVAGVGVIEGSNQQAAASDAVDFLLSEQAQRYFADTTAEYPVVEGVQSTEHDLVPLDTIEAAPVDLDELDSLEQTLELLQEVGLT